MKNVMLAMLSLVGIYAMSADLRPKYEEFATTSLSPMSVARMPLDQIIVEHLS